MVKDDTLKKEHRQHVDAWHQAMRYGLLNGRPYSEHCIKLYLYQVGWFLKRFDTVSFDNLKQALMAIPVEQFAKRMRLFEALNCFARFLIQEGVLDESYLEESRRVKPRRHLPPKKTTVDADGLEKLLECCNTPLERFLVILLSETGLRASEAASLMVEDIHLEKRFLNVRRAKWGKTRRVGLTPKAIQAISDYLGSCPPLNSPYLMHKPNGKPMDRHGILARINKLGREAGIAVNPHALRRAFVTLNANKGRPLVMLQIACGHSNISTTRSYCMTTEDETIQSMATWE